MNCRRERKKETGRRIKSQMSLVPENGQNEAWMQQKKAGKPEILPKANANVAQEEDNQLDFIENYN